MKFTIANALTIIDKHKVEIAKKMGMTFNNLYNSCTNVEAIPKDQYENCLKADMVTMLEDLKKEIEELPFPQREPEYMQGYSYCQMNILDYVIQQKIDKLKENKGNE